MRARGINLEPKPPNSVFLQVLLDKGLVEGLNELKVISEKDLNYYLSNPYLSREPFNIQQIVNTFGGEGYDFVRGLCIGLTSGVLCDAETLSRDIRGCLAVLANDNIDIINGEPLNDPAS